MTRFAALIALCVVACARPVPPPTPRQETVTEHLARNPDPERCRPVAEDGWTCMGEPGFCPLWYEPCRKRPAVVPDTATVQVGAEYAAPTDLNSSSAAGTVARSLAGLSAR